MLEELRKIVQEVNAASDLQAALDIIVSRVRGAMGTEVCTVYLYDATKEQYIFRANEGLNQDLIGKVGLAKGEGLVGKAVFTGDGYSFQIWSAPAHAAQLAEDEAALAEMDGDDFEVDFAAAAMELAL